MAKPKKSKAPKQTRYMIRCSENDLASWEQRAEALGFGSAGAWMVRVANEALREPIPSP